MRVRWRRPTRAEIARLATECEERGVSPERAEAIIADARRSPEEAARDEGALLARLDAEAAERRARMEAGLRAWHDEHRGFNPPRKLAPESAVYQPGWAGGWAERQPHAPRPWFWIEPRSDGSSAWDGRCFVKCGWEEVEPRPCGYHEAWRMARLYPSAVECLDAAVEISDAMGTDCEVHAFPSEAYYPPWGDTSGVILDLMRLRWWARLLVGCANSRYNAGIDPRTPIPEWVRRGYLPRGEPYPANGLCFWRHESTGRFWELLQRDFAPPTYLRIIERRGDAGSDAR